MKKLMRWLVLGLALVVAGCSNTSKKTEVDTTLYVQRILDFNEDYKQAESYAKDLYADEVSEVEHLKERIYSKWEWLSDLEFELEIQLIDTPSTDEEENYNRRLANAFNEKYYKELDERETDWETLDSARKSLEQTMSEEIIYYLTDRYSENYFDFNDEQEVVFSKEGFVYF